MSEAIIIAENIGKRYILNHQGPGGYKRFSEALVESAKGFINRSHKGRGSAATEEFWALKDVSFEIKRGEVVGIIGRNGAGKSTLLKILSRITEPTTGRITLKGRVASLLEVGTGFHPELTGRENIYLNGAILGMQRSEIKARFDEIVAFAEIEKFLDTPVKRYSSGMYVRLAFAVAAHLEPEILIVDEVLAVGDAKFQKKCLGLMREIGKSGRSIIFVTHQMGLVLGLCDRAIRLSQGSVMLDGTPQEVVAGYLREDSASDRFSKPAVAGKAAQLLEAEIVEVAVDSTSVTLALHILAAKNMQLSIDLRLLEATGVAVGYTSLGTLDDSDSLPLQAGLNRSTVVLDTSKLANGNYLVSIDLNHPNIQVHDRSESCLSFSVNRAPAGSGQSIFQQSWGYGSYEMTLHLIKLEAVSSPHQASSEILR